MPCSERLPVVKARPDHGHLGFPPFGVVDGRLRVPTRLPPPLAHRPVQLEDLDLDEELKESGATLAFTLATLRGLALELLQAGQVARPLLDDLPPPDASVHNPSLIRCKTSAASLCPPTHVLDIHFSDGHEPYRTPVHGLLWALQCPVLAHLSKRRDAADADATRDDSVLLPLVRVDLPCRPSWPLLHRYIYDGSPAALLAGLLSPPAARTQLPSAWKTRSSLNAALYGLMMRLSRVREVWLDAASLEMSDAALWDTLERAWAVLVAELQDLVGQAGLGDQSRVA